MIERFTALETKDKLKLIGFVILIPVLGYLTTFFFDPKQLYESRILLKPSFAPPTWLFGVAWTFLYATLGLFLYVIVQRKDKKNIFIFIIQLLVNLSWCLVFFNGKMFWLAFVMILIMIVLTALLLYMNRKGKSFYVLIPYMAWLIFAAILNYSIAIRN